MFPSALDGFPSGFIPPPQDGPNVVLTGTAVDPGRATRVIGCKSTLTCHVLSNC